MTWIDRLKAWLQQPVLPVERPGVEQKFTPASDMNWTRIETLVHGPGTYPWGENSSGDGNSAVFACLMALAMAYPEPPITVYTKRASPKRASRKTPIPNHPLQALLDKPTPNGELSMEDIWFWTAWAKHTDGNAYWLKVRSGNALTGNVVELWPVSPGLIHPVTLKTERGRSREWISHYSMQVAPNEYEIVPKGNVIHFKLGVDDRDMRRGLSPLKRLVRETSTDDEAGKFTDALLKNYAVPGLVVWPTGDAVVDEDGANRIKATLHQNFSGDNRGAISVMSQESKVEQFGFSPEQMNLSVIHRIPEERIAAVIGVPAIVAGLGAGLDRATFANFKEAREMLTEQKLVPMWRQDAARLNVSLKPDFAADRGIFVEFDLSDVRALQEDEDKKYVRLNTGVMGKWILRNEARSDIGLDPIDGWDEEDMNPPAPVIAPPEEEDEPAGDGDDQEGEKRLPFPRTNGHRGNGRHNGATLTAVRHTKQSTRQLVDARRRVRANVARAAEKDIAKWFRSVAAVVASRANGGKSLQRKALTLSEWQRIVALVFNQETPVLEGIIASHALDVIAGTWGLVNTELNQVIAFNENDPLVLQVLEAAGDRIQGITQTTLDELRAVLPGLYDEGLGTDEIASRIRDLITETYSGRAEAIARTEIGLAQQGATAGRYDRAGVKHVQVFDNGFDNSHEFCRKVNGKVVTLDWAERNPLQHPNCVRAFGAVFDYEGDVFTEEQPWT